MDSDLLAQLRLTEGTLFKNESVKRFFIDTKTLIIGLMTEYSQTPEYESKIDILLIWNSAIEESLVERCETIFPDMLTRLTPTCVTYAKSLYNKPGQDVNLLLQEPKFSLYLKSIFTRVATTPCFINKSFFDFDPINQDFILRDIFRQALSSDCIILREEEYPAKIEEIYPSDSVSQVFCEPPQLTNFQQLEVAVKQLEKNDSRSEVSSVCKVPLVKRIELSGEE
jgi:hypothetical protein